MNTPTPTNKPTKAFTPTRALTPDEQRAACEARIDTMQQNGTIQRIGRLIVTAKYMSEIAAYVMGEAQDIIYAHGFYRNELKKLLNDYDRLTERIAKQFARAYLKNSDGEMEQMRRDFAEIFPIVMRAIGAEADVKELLDGLEADYAPFDPEAEGSQPTRSISFRVTPATYNRLHALSADRAKPMAHMLRRLIEQFCRENKIRKKPLSPEH
jgi:hypothetical protein